MTTPFDFQAAIAAANEAVERSQQSKNSGGSSTYAYPLLYPPAGNTVVFRPLFNPASGQILRLVNRHEKVACYRTYNQDCPICKVMQQVKDVTGQDPFGRNKASKSRGICFAQFISSTLPIDKGNNRGVLQAGETVLMMFPWSVYNQINAIIQAAAQTPTGMDQAFSHAQTGLFLQISVTNDFKYQTVNIPFMTSPVQMNDDQFMEFLGGMPSLNEQVLPSAINDDTRKQVDEYADAIYRQYIAPRLAQPQVAPSPMSINQQISQPSSGAVPGFVPQGYNPGNVQGYPPYSAAAPQSGQYQPAPASAPSPAQTPVVYNPAASQASPATTYNPAQVQQQNPSSTTPSCFGKHNDNDTKCICCPCELECMNNSQIPF